jgi:hypothetical protein
MIERKNFSGQVSPDVGGETEFSQCNFTQPEPVLDGALYVGVRLFPGDDTPRTFTKCNLVNCETPPGSTMTGCNQSISRTMIVTSTDELVIDGHTIETPFYSDFIYGWRTAEGVYEYHPTPVEIPNGRVVE